MDIVPNDGSLTQGSPSTRVVSSSDTAGTSESTSVDTSDLTVDSGDSGAPQAKRLCPHRRQRTGFDTSWYAAHPCLIKRKACFASSALSIKNFHEMEVIFTIAHILQSLLNYARIDLEGPSNEKFSWGGMPPDPPSWCANAHFPPLFFIFLARTL